MEMMDLKTIYTILHVLGAIIGAGASFTGDYIFLRATKDGMIDKSEINMIKASSNMVWAGLALIVLSGVGLFTIGFPAYLYSSKFQLKMLVVLILIINGVIFHNTHIPVLEKRVDKKLYPKTGASESFLVLSGVISVVSWLTTIILGSLRSIPYTFSLGFSIYLVFIALGALVAYILEHGFASKYELSVLRKAFFISISLSVLIGLVSYLY